MNILICGKQSGLCRQLADRLSREKSEIYYLSGNKSDEKLSKNVFQEYHFPYLHENIDQIFNSSKPETVIIAGAHDENYTWVNADQDSTKFVTSMTSLFMAAQNEGAKRLIYLSSTEVFENNTEDVITSSTKPLAESVRLKAFLKAERLLSEFKSGDEKKNMEIIILRLPTVFGEYHSGSLYDVCLRSALYYVKNGIIPVIPELQHTAIYFSDAVEAVIRCQKLPYTQENRLFQIRGLSFNEESLGNTLIETKWRKDGSLQVQSSYDKLYSGIGYPPARIDEGDELSLGLSLRYDLKRACDLLCKDCLRINKKNDEKIGEKIQLLPILESIIIGLVTYWVSSYIYGTWVGEGLNLFIIYVLLFAISYGMTFGLFTSILGGLGLLLILVKEDSLIEVISNYVFYLEFWQLILVGVISGYVRDKYKRKNKQLTEENGYLDLELKDVTLINDSNAYVKNIFEKRLIGYTNSLSRIYELTTELDFYESQKVVFQAVRMVSELMEMKDIAIYTASSNPVFFRLSASTSELSSSCGRTFKVEEGSFIYDNIKKKTIYMNRECIEQRPTFGGGVYLEGKLIALILIWTKDLRQVNLYASNMLAISCRLIEKSMGRAFLYEKSLRNDIYEKNSNIMNQTAFVKMLNIFEDGFKQGLLFYTVIHIISNGHSSSEASHMVRDTDIVGIVNGEMYIILSFANTNEAQIVIDRYTKKGMNAVPVSPKKIIEDGYEMLNESEEPEESEGTANEQEESKENDTSEKDNNKTDNDSQGVSG